MSAVYVNRNSKESLLKIVGDKGFEDIDMPIMDRVYAVIYLCGFLDLEYMKMAKEKKISEALLTSKTSDTFFYLCAFNYNKNVHFVPERFHNILVSHAKYTWGYNISENRTTNILNDPRIFMVISSTNYQIIIEDFKKFIDRKKVTNMNALACFNMIIGNTRITRLSFGFDRYHEEIIYSKILKAREYIR